MSRGLLFFQTQCSILLIICHNHEANASKRYQHKFCSLTQASVLQKKAYWVMAKQITNFTTNQQLPHYCMASFYRQHDINNIHHKNDIHTWSPVPAKWTHTGLFLLSGQTFGRIIWKLKLNSTNNKKALYCKRECATAVVHVWKPSKTKSKSVARGRQTTRGYSVFLVLTRGQSVWRVSLSQCHIDWISHIANFPYPFI